MTAPLLRLQVRQITQEAEGIKLYELVAVDLAALPPFDAGAHIDLHTPAGPIRQYSLCNDPSERHRYVIGVLDDPQGQGGSRSVHRELRAGDLITVSPPRNRFALAENASRHLLLAGGIGVTPMMAMIERLRALGADFVLHYCTRAPHLTAFCARLAPLVAQGRAVHHFDGGDPARGLDIAALLARYEPGTHLYYCGPTGFMQAVERAARHWPSNAVHFEYFSPPEPAGRTVRTEADFEVRLARTGRVVPVRAGGSIVEALRVIGVEVQTSCEAGTCGTCRTRYLGGAPVHNDFVLTEDEKQKFVILCCAGCRSAQLVLDL